MRSEYIDRFLSAGQYCWRARCALPTAPFRGASWPSTSNLWRFAQPAVSGMLGSPSRFTMSGDDVSRGTPDHAVAGRSYVLPSTASVIAPKAPRREKSSGLSWPNTTMSSAVSSPTFSMWCRAPESTWNIWPGPIVKLENSSALSKTVTSRVPERQ